MVAEPDPVTLLLEDYQDHRDDSQSQAGQAVGKSRPWASNKLRDLEPTGYIRRGSHGVEVLKDATR